MSAQRQQNISQLAQAELDVLIIGGGINGAVSAAALAARGTRVGLIDGGDFAGMTSSNSSNLAWGGIKYMETGEFGLVNKLCKSRNHLMSHYPSSVTEMRFMTTIQKGFRMPVWMVYMGTLVYWLFGRFFTAPPRYLTRRAIKAREPNINVDNARAGFEYSDAFLVDNDARFVFNFISAAMKQGAYAANYVRANGSTKQADGWLTEAEDVHSGQRFQIRSKAIINACGPMADHYNRRNKQQTEYHHLFSKGVHLTVDRISKEQRVLAFFASDGRLFFVLPMGSKTCIGTTDDQVQSPITAVTDADRQFILDNANKLLDLDKPLTRDDIIAERCGVRPLAIKAEEGVADWVALSRKHALDVNQDDHYISVFGGKLTDCINVGDEIADIVEEFGIDMNAAQTRWYGEPSADRKDQFMRDAASAGLDELTPESALEPLSQRYWRRYGNDAFELLASVRQQPALAAIAIEHTQLTWAEIHWVAGHEMVMNFDDLLRRRSKASLLIRKELLQQARGLEQAAHILFGEQAEQRLAEFRVDVQSSATHEYGAQKLSA